MELTATPFVGKRPFLVANYTKPVGELSAEEARHYSDPAMPCLLHDLRMLVAQDGAAREASLLALFKRRYAEAVERMQTAETENRAAVAAAHDSVMLEVASVEEHLTTRVEASRDELLRRAEATDAALTRLAVLTRTIADRAEADAIEANEQLMSRIGRMESSILVDVARVESRIYNEFWQMLCHSLWLSIRRLFRREKP